MDISLHGARLEAISADIKNGRCVLTLFSHSSDVSSFTVIGRIVLQDSEKVCVDFQTMDREDFEAYKVFLSYHVRHPWDAIFAEADRGDVPALADWKVP